MVLSTVLSVVLSSEMCCRPIPSPASIWPSPPKLTSSVPHCPRCSQIVAIAKLDIVLILLQPRELGGVIYEQCLFTFNCNLTDRQADRQTNAHKWPMQE